MARRRLIIGTGIMGEGYASLSLPKDRIVTMIEAYPRTVIRPPGRSYYATLVPFPVVCFIGALITDLAYWATASVTWETFSVWLLTIGLVVVGFAILAGLIDLFRSRQVAGLNQPLFSVFGHMVAIGLSLINAFVHSRDGYTAVVPQGLVLSALVVLVLFVTGLMRQPTIHRSPAGVTFR